MSGVKETVSPLYVVAGTSEIEDPVGPRVRTDRRLKRVQCIAWAVGVIAVLALVAAAVLAWLYVSELNKQPAGSGGTPPVPPGPPRVPRLSEVVNITTMMSTLRGLERIAVAHGNTRSILTGYNDSSAYIESLLTQMGSSHISFKRVPFSFLYSRPNGPVSMQQLSPPATFAKADFIVMVNSGNGDITGNIRMVPNFGCAAGDFAGFPPGWIAVAQRGVCTFAIKANFATAAGAKALLVYNQGTPDRLGTFTGLVSPGTTIPAVGFTYAQGNLWAQLTKCSNVTMRVTVNMVSSQTTTFNLIVDTDIGNSTSIITLGAHMDSVTQGPGINDNGSGVAGLLEVLRRYNSLYLSNPSRWPLIKHRLRFAFWGAEETGMTGSAAWANALSTAELSKLLLYINTDMLGSPNFIRRAMNTTGSTFDSKLVMRSQSLVNRFVSYWQAHNLPFKQEVYNGNSDHASFANRGVPFVNLDAGVAEIKSVQEQSVFGGISTVALDPCYHAYCDNVGNINQVVFLDMTQAIASVLEDLLTSDNVW